MRLTVFFSSFIMLTACASLSPRADIENQFIEFGLSQDRAACLADELDQRLDSSDLRDVADYVAGLNDVDSAGSALDALLRIENPRAVSAIGGASLACAFSGGN